MYLNADDARSDFFLAAAVYVIGPALLALARQALPVIFDVTLIDWLIIITAPFLLTAAMPLYLMRYREESWSGLFGGSSSALATGLTLGGLVAVGNAIAAVLVGVPVGEVLTGTRIVVWVGLLVQWGSLAILAIFLVRRGEYAFRVIDEPQSELVRKAGYACVGTAGVTTVLLLLADRPLVSVLPAAGLIGMFFLAEQRMPQEGPGERWWVYAPLITLALGPLEIFALFFGGANFVASAQQAAIVATFGLVAVMALHARRGGKVVLGAAIALGVSSLLGLVNQTGFAVFAV
ncbi:hypothetical protein [Euzebya tangerina]|uniref:hypothetical protein n=1 Tax=Euzebya tangerina TaxID=591198 RepID=UPI000E30C1EF|nr:hypothetical protein [Euzebya tangerina]